jgi:NAD+ diphosphatase
VIRPIGAAENTHLPKRPESREPAFSGMALDRGVTLRTDASWIARQIEAPTTRAVAASRDGVLLDGGPLPALVRRSLALRSDRLNGLEPILLGLEDGAALFAIDLDALSPSASASFAGEATIVGLRDAGAVLSRSEGGLAAYLVALLNWHRRHRFCANCGAPTVVAEAGYSRRCLRCDAVHFPRTDPVVIMLVTDGGRVLLGRHRGWPRGQYSALAGFVAPGESLEEAVVREVHEESGIEASDPVFVTSQPWPFPSSLMLGFAARSDGGQPAARDGELEDVGWFTLEDVRAAQAEAGTALRLPPRISIARFLIERWAADASRARPAKRGPAATRSTKPR